MARAPLEPDEYRCRLREGLARDDHQLKRTTYLSHVIDILIEAVVAEMGISRAELIRRAVINEL